MFADLSFNNIDVIEGLDKLPKLQDLTLYNNRISAIENMDNLAQLHVLSLGNNDLEKLENVSRLCSKFSYVVVVYATGRRAKIQTVIHDCYNLPKKMKLKTV